MLSSKRLYSRIGARSISPMLDLTRLFRRAINYELSERKLKHFIYEMFARLRLELVPMETARVQESCLPSGVSKCDYTMKITNSQSRPSSQGSWGCPKVCLAQDYGKFSDKD